MAHKKLDRALFTFLNDEQIALLESLCASRHKKAKWNMNELCNKLGIRPPKATLIMATLSSRKLAEHYLLVYHNNCEPIPIMRRLYRQGLPVLPVECKECQREIDDPVELRYDSEMRLIQKKAS